MKKQWERGEGERRGWIQIQLDVIGFLAQAQECVIQIEDEADRPAIKTRDIEIDRELDRQIRKRESGIERERERQIEREM